MATFPNDQSANGQQNLVVCLDPALQIPAPIFSAITGATIPESTIVAGPDGLWPMFTCAGVEVLYSQDDTGAPVTLHAAAGDGSAVSVTGSWSGGTAGPSLIMALRAQGVNIVDNTTA